MKYKVDNVKNSIKGWICGQFFPQGSIQKNSKLEVKVSLLKPGDYEPKHLHPKGTEVVIVVSGEVKYKFNGQKHTMKSGDFIFMKNKVYEELIEVKRPTKVISVRTPSVPNNKAYAKKHGQKKVV